MDQISYQEYDQTQEVQWFMLLLQRWNKIPKPDSDSWVYTLCQTQKVLSILYPQLVYLWHQFTNHAKPWATLHSPEESVICLRAHSPWFSLPVDTLWCSSTVCLTLQEFWPITLTCTSVSPGLEHFQTRSVISYNGVGMVSQAVRLHSVISFTVTVCLGYAQAHRQGRSTPCPLSSHPSDLMVLGSRAHTLGLVKWVSRPKISGDTNKPTSWG